jgi:hypothetical protein
MKHVFIAGLMIVSCAAAVAKLPAASPEAKAKADEAAAKTAHAGKVGNYQLCKSQDQVADKYRAVARKEGKALGDVVATPACADPGPFVYAPPAAASAPAVAEPAKKG